MKNDKIRESWDKIGPDEAANERILSAVLEENRAVHEGRKGQTAKKGFRWIPVVAGLAVLIAVIGILGWKLEWFGRKSGTGTTGEHQSDTERILADTTEAGTGNQAKSSADGYTVRLENGDTVAFRPGRRVGTEAKMDLPASVVERELTDEEVKRLLPESLKEQSLKDIQNPISLGSGGIGGIFNENKLLRIEGLLGGARVILAGTGVPVSDEVILGQETASVISGIPVTTGIAIQDQNGERKARAFVYTQFQYGDVTVNLELVGNEEEAETLCRNMAEMARQIIENGEPELAVVTFDGTSGSAVVVGEEVSVGGPYGRISLRVPNTWDWDTSKVDEGKLESATHRAYGIIVKPKGAAQGQMEIYCGVEFGLCGTGLVRSKATLAGMDAWVEVYDGQKHWDYVVFEGDYPQLIVSHTDCSSWTDEMWDEAWSFLDTVTYDRDKKEGGIGLYTSESECEALSVVMSAYHVTPSGCTVVFRNFEKKTEGEMLYGSGYAIERQNGDTWELLPEVIDNAAFTAEAYTIPPEGESEIEVNWEWLYGQLEPGTYRIIKSVIDHREDGNITYTLRALFILEGE